MFPVLLTYFTPNPPGPNVDQFLAYFSFGECRAFCQEWANHRNAKSSRFAIQIANFVRKPRFKLNSLPFPGKIVRIQQKDGSSKPFCP